MLDTKEQLKELSSALTFAADFKDYFRQILEFIKKMKIENKEEMTAVLTAMKNLSDRMIEDMADKMETGNYSDMEKKKKEMMAYCEKEMDKMMKDCKVKMAEMDKKMAEMKDGMDADMDLTASMASDLAITAVLPKIPTLEAIEADLHKLGGSIASALELLPDGDKLKIEAIQDLRKEIEELRQLRTQTLGGGGFSVLAFQQHILSWTATSVSPNGVLTDFVIAYTPNPTNSLEVMVDNSPLFETSDWTYATATKTITFLIAPPSGSTIRYKCLV